jgi:hypothetical protein
LKTKVGPWGLEPQTSTGTFYLTYVQELAMEDLRQAYPGIDEFFQKKHAMDPENRFTSRFFEMYGKQRMARKAASGS